ncbi:hypothetical protein D3C71_1438320 [compost metagenome]
MRGVDVHAQTHAATAQFGYAGVKRGYRGRRRALAIAKLLQPHGNGVLRSQPVPYAFQGAGLVALPIPGQVGAADIARIANEDAHAVLRHVQGQAALQVDEGALGEKAVPGARQAVFHPCRTHVQGKRGRVDAPHHGLDAADPGRMLGQADGVADRGAGHGAVEDALAVEQGTHARRQAQLRARIADVDDGRPVARHGIGLGPGAQLFIQLARALHQGTVPLVQQIGIDLVVQQRDAAQHQEDAGEETNKIAAAGGVHGQNWK